MCVLCACMCMCVKDVCFHVCAGVYANVCVEVRANGRYLFLSFSILVFEPVHLV